MNAKVQAKFQMIKDMLKKEFGWADIIADGKAKNGAYIKDADGKIYALSTAAGGQGLVLESGWDQYFMVLGMTAEFNTKEDFVRNQCAEINKKVREKIGA